ncbi:PCI domain-containing protein 2-like [Xenia sp. Carnegie-2017]|uniref:PCI domain-containing protein 2-like n=1 Tax=Xenia sp. Carnegie-2017 TaxID=2897299 RepID=UPI001F04B67A|nr:PCI domain-containing protein 2-like [Xenia sp. Carnegie-2017]
MADLMLKDYLFQVSCAIDSRNGDEVAMLLSLKDVHFTNANLHLENAQDSCQQFLVPPYDEMFAAHLRALWAMGKKNFLKAFACQDVVVQAFVKAFQTQKDENWSLPIMKCVVSDLRLLGLEVDNQLTKSGEGKSGETLERAAEVIMGCFRVCAADSRAAKDVSKKWGMLALVNHLFKIYFKTNRIHLCKPLIRAIDSLAIKDQFEISNQVTYRYYVGRKAMFDNDLKLAEEYLDFAFQHCHKNNRKNKRLVLIYLVPVKMLAGRMPPREILQKYDLMQYDDIVRAVRSGNLLLLNNTLERHEAFFITYGVFLILEKLKMITYRNLFKKVYILLKTHQIPLPSFVSSLHFLKIDDMDVIEVQCIVANLIFEGYIKGYISHQHQKLVVSKQNPFPPLSSFL